MKMNKKQLIVLLMVGVHTVTGATLLNEDFESYTVPGGATHVNLTAITGATVTNSVDVCNASNPLAPVGTGSKFLDVVGVNGINSVTWDLTVVAGTLYTVSFNAAASSPQVTGQTVHSPTTIIRVIDQGVIPAPVPLVTRSAAEPASEPLRIHFTQSASQSVGGTSPTNLTSSVTYNPVQSVYSTNAWIANTFTFTPASTSVKFTILAQGDSNAHCANAFIDDLVITSP